MKRKQLSIIVGGVLIGTATYAATTYTSGASSISMKVQGLYLSTSADCSNPTTVFEDASATAKDFASALDLGGGEIDDGTYNCVILKVSDQLSVGASSSAGGLCAKFKGQDMYSFVNLNNGTNSDNGYRGTDLTGTNLGVPVGPSSAQDDGTLSGLGGLSSAGEQSIYLFFTTGTADSDIFRKPDGAGHGGIHMNTSITVSGPTNLSFKLAATTSGKSIKDLKDSGTECTFDDSNWTMKVEKVQ